MYGIEYERVRIINEPTAAALAYGLNKKEEQKIVVYDFGGGTFDVSILEVDEGFVEVKSTNGDTHLGGDDVDHVLIDWLVSEFKKEHNLDLFKLPGGEMAQQRVRQAAENAKKELSSAPQTNISLPFLYADQNGPRNLERSLSRSQFEQMIMPVIERTLEPCRKALADAKLVASDIDEVILVGGSTRIPLVQEKVTKFFGRDSNRSVNPDEVVAMGAAIQGGILSKDEDLGEMLLLDVTPLSLGLDTLGGILNVLIERNSPVPTKKSQVYSTAADNQTAVDIMVYQGERKMSKDNRLLGQFQLSGIEPAPRGMPQIEVTFDINADGILTVTAKDKKTGASKNIEIKSASGLSDEDIQRMKDEAAENAEADAKAAEAIEVTNKLDSEIYQIGKMLDENKDKMPGHIVTQFEGILQEATEAKDSGDIDQMKAASEKLNQMTQQMQQAAAQAQAGSAQAADPQPAGSDDDIIDVTPE